MGAGIVQDSLQHSASVPQCWSPPPYYSQSWAATEQRQRLCHILSGRGAVKWWGKAKNKNVCLCFPWPPLQRCSYFTLPGWCSYMSKVAALKGKIHTSLHKGFAQERETYFYSGTHMAHITVASESLTIFWMFILFILIKNPTEAKEGLKLVWFTQNSAPHIWRIQ